MLYEISNPFTTIRHRSMKRYFLLCVMALCGSLSVLQAQDTTYQQLYEMEYARRIRLEKINGRYIPKDVDDAMKELDKLVDQVGKSKFKSQPEDLAASKIHFSFGRWMIVNWGFYEGSRLSHYLKGLGVSYPDDMATTLMICYHRHLHGKELGLADLAKTFAEKRRKEVEGRLLQGQILESRSVPKN